MTPLLSRSLFVVVASLFVATGIAAERELVPFRVPAKQPDAAEILSPTAIHIDGWLGTRLAANEKNRLLQVDTEPLLAGFHKKPGSHPWIGEHVGKWLHAATLAWAYTGDPALREKLDRVVAELISCQEPDGYLGTYLPEQRLALYPGADWDVWSHKYNLLGLLTYYQCTGNGAALEACRKIGDLLANTFPAKRSILAAGTHVGMAATSVLEPMVLLYRFTGDQRYLEFARYLVNSWDEPNGPKIIATLLQEKQVNKTANAKAYEMLSNLVGLCEFARMTGDRDQLQVVLNAWQDIVANRLYITGSASQSEHFHGDHELPNQTGAHVAETCVTTTWIQFNLQLLRLTGEAKFGNELERTIYNHLAAAQRPDGAQWCYFTALEGRKPYGSGINCCVSSGPRGMALAPLTTYLRVVADGSPALAISTLETSRASLELGGQQVTVQQDSQFPRHGSSALTFQLSKPAVFGVQVRIPTWAAPLTLSVNGKAVEATVRDGWAVLPARTWQDQDHVDIRFSLGASVIIGAHGNANRAALVWGPFVLAYDESRNPGLPAAGAIRLTEELAKPPFTLKPGNDLAFAGAVSGRRGSDPQLAIFVPFADAGADGTAYRVWLRVPGADPGLQESLLADGEESRSREGNMHGSINDGDAENCVVTFNGRPANEDWYAVTLATPVAIRRVVFAHGQNFHDGGWFDTSEGKPQVQVQTEKGGRWEPAGELAEYPATTATDGSRVKVGQKFTLQLPARRTVSGVRIVGKPASGDNSKQAFSSCGELEAFGE